MRFDLYFVMRPILLACSLAVAPWCAQAENVAPLPLRLVGAAGSVEFGEVTVVDKRLHVISSDTLKPVAPETNWRLEGDLLAQASSFVFSPFYRMYVRMIPGGPAVAGFPAQHLAYVQVRGDESWTDRELEGGILVFAWVVDGRPIFVKPVPVTIDVQRERDIAGAAVFVLDDKSKGGAPVVLLRKKNQWIKPTPRFRYEPADRALAAMHFGTPEAFASELRHLSAWDRSTQRGATLLQFAAEGGFTAAAQTLIAGKAKINREADGWGSPLWAAASNGRREIVSLLVAMKAARSRGEAASTPFEEAVRRGHVDTAIELLDTYSGGTFNQLVVEAINQNNDAAMEKILAKDRTKAAAKLPAGALARAIELQNPKILQALLSAGMSGKASIDNVPLIVMAGATGNVQVIDTLLSAGAKVDASAADGLTALIAAARAGHADACGRLLRAGANVDLADARGMPPLHHAILYGQSDAVTLILKAQAKLETRNAFGKTALELALSMQFQQAVRELELAGARLDPKSPGFEASVLHAIALDRVGLLKGAAASGWNANARPSEDWTFAEIATLNGASACSAFLASEVASPRTRSSVEFKPDHPPTRIAGEKPLEVRTEDFFESATISVQGIVDQEGRFRFGKIRRCDDPRLVLPTLAALETWKFQPARKADAVVNTQVEIPLVFPGKDNAIKLSADIQRPPIVREETLVRQTVGTLVSDQARTQYNTNVSTSSVNGTLVTTVTEEARQSPGLTVFSSESASAWAFVSLVVEKDGSPSSIQMIDGSSGDFIKTARKAVEKYTFFPGVKNGAPTRARIAFAIRAE